MKKLIYVSSIIALTALFSFKGSNEIMLKNSTENGIAREKPKVSSKNPTPVVMYDFKTKKIVKLDKKALERSKRNVDPRTSGNSPSGIYYAGQRVATSSNGLYKLEYQIDGDLRLYTSSNVPLWNTKTAGQVAGHVDFNADGQIYLRSPNTWNAYWWTAYTWRELPVNPVTTPFGTNFYWILQNDGNFVGYFHFPTYNPVDVAMSTGTAGGHVSSRSGRID